MEKEFLYTNNTLSSLSEEESGKPQQVIAELFDFAHLPELKQMLWDWLKTTVTGSYNKTLSNRERTTILLLYEYLDKLLEANYLLHTELKKQEENKKEEQVHIF